MRFLSKNPHSSILLEGLTYKKNSSINNQKLLEKLKQEQKNFCAYTEQYFKDTDSPEVEHFNSCMKYDDNYYNYYVVTRSANLTKKKKDYEYKQQAIAKSSFFSSLFHQTEDIFNRIQYVKGEYVFEEVDPDDIEARDLIDFLGFNHEILRKQRRAHIRMLKGIFNDANYTEGQKLKFFQEHPEQLSYITALELELGLDLSDLLK